MTDTQKLKNPSPLLQAVLKLDTYFSELIRLGAKIETLDLKSDFDFEQAERLIKSFAKNGEGVSEEIVLMLNALTDLRTQAEAAATIVAERADILQARKNEQQAKMEHFRVLGEKVRDLTASLSAFKMNEGANLSDEERASLTAHLAEFETQLRPLIEEAQALKKEGQQSKIKILEQSADSLGQSLAAVSQKLSAVREQQQHH
jgi:chromosome segregation ATPase